MVLITNRQAGAYYTFQDLNRVEAAVAQLQTLARQAGLDMNLQTKTDWALPGTFSRDSWPVASQMSRYLDNVRTLRDALGLDSPLPASMDRLTWQQANQIEQALADVYAHLLSLTNNNEGGET